MSDEEVIALLYKVDALRAELRTLEPQLSKACNQYGQRRGMAFYREFHLRNALKEKTT